MASSSNTAVAAAAAAAISDTANDTAVDTAIVMWRCPITPQQQLPSPQHGTMTYQLDYFANGGCIKHIIERRGHLEPVLMLLELVPPQCHCCAK